MLAWRAAERRAEEAERAAQPEVRLRCALAPCRPCFPACDAQCRQAAQAGRVAAVTARGTTRRSKSVQSDARAGVLAARAGAVGDRRQRTGPHPGPGAAAPPPAAAGRQHAGGAQPAAPLLQGASRDDGPGVRSPPPRVSTRRCIRLSLACGDSHVSSRTPVRPALQQLFADTGDLRGAVAAVREQAGAAALAAEEERQRQVRFRVASCSWECAADARVCRARRGRRTRSRARASTCRRLTAAGWPWRAP